MFHSKKGLTSCCTRTPQTVTIFAEQKYMPICYAGEQGVTCTRKKMRKLILTFLLMPLLSHAEVAKIENVTVHLFLEKSGIFSQDITTTKEFMAHNFRPFGEGIPTEEIFHSYLVKILFTSSAEAFIEGNVARVQITNDKDKSIVIDQNISNLYIGPEKAIHKSILVTGNECEFQTVVVSTNEKTITKKLPFHCGE